MPLEAMDVVVIGAGPVGRCCNCSSRCWSTRIIERERKPGGVSNASTTVSDDSFWRTSVDRSMPTATIRYLERGIPVISETYLLNIAKTKHGRFLLQMQTARTVFTLEARVIATDAASEPPGRSALMESPRILTAGTAQYIVNIQALPTCRCYPRFRRHWPDYGQTPDLEGAEVEGVW